MINLQVDIFEGKYKLIKWENTAFQAGAPCGCSYIYMYVYISNNHLLLIILSIIFLYK